MSGEKKWCVVGYFPFMPVVVSRHKFKDEALAAAYKLTASGPHMGESYVVEYNVKEDDDVESDVTAT